MTLLRDRTPVDCSIGETQRRLAAYFASVRAADGVARVRLRVPLTTNGGRTALSLGRDVRVEVRESREDASMYITWEPEGRTVLPKFEGTLTVRRRPDGSYIELDGSYAPPLDGAGQIFDDLIGHRIAESTAREFLKDLRSAVESPR